MVITLSSDYLYVLSMLKTTPLVVTVGLSLTIPLAVIGDFFLSKPTRGQVILGAILVLISFIVVGVDDTNTRKEEDMLEEDTVDDGRGMQGHLRLRREVEFGTTE
jgi:solute carrier family 35 protein F5